MIAFGPDICQEYGAASSREWLETNGLGSFASGTVAGSHTRRYHGLLVAATRPPVGRLLLLSKLEESLQWGGNLWELSTNQYHLALHPKGYRLVERFALDPWPQWTFRLGGLRLLKEIFMPHGRQATAISYSLLEGSEGLTLEVRPLVASRNYHALTYENSVLNPRVQVTDGAIETRPYQGLPLLRLCHSAGRFQAESIWYRNFEYLEELARGLEGYEDLWSPGLFRLEMAPGRPAILLATLDAGLSAADLPALAEEERSRRQKCWGFGRGNRMAGQLMLAADQFLVRRGDGHSIIAGYPWFTDWGRDTMIALPGLCLARGRYAEARGILETFAQTVDGGVIANRFLDAGKGPEYNTIDAALWFIHASDAYVQASGDRVAMASLYPTLVGIVEAHREGTRYGIRVDEDGLLMGGEPGVQLTWMDAKVGDWVVTPRWGKPVEVQALWYNGLRTLADWGQGLGCQADVARFTEWANRAYASFNRVFWHEAGGYCYDCFGPNGPDPALRPNQLLALSLPYPILDQARWEAVLLSVERALLTPYGLRTLSPSDPAYRGRCEGDQRSRDGALHQGTVWPWLLGPYVTALLRARGRTPETLASARQLMDSFTPHLSEAGLGSVSEIFDGDMPHLPRGCIAQAWSVAELIRIHSMLRDSPSILEAR